MNKLEMVAFLMSQAKRPSQSIEDLNEVFENYKKMLLALGASDTAYSKGLLRLREEFPDIERLIGKKHTEIIKGRLIDAINAFRKKVEEVEGMEKPAAPPQEQAGEEKPRVRNMPNLGMS